MTAREAPPYASDRARLRLWLELVAQTAIDWLDDLDAPVEDIEDDEREICSEDDWPRDCESSSHRGRP